MIISVFAQKEKIFEESKFPFLSKLIKIKVTIGGKAPFSQIIDSLFIIYTQKHKKMGHCELFF